MSLWRPSVTVAAVIERDGRFLLVRERIDGRLVLNQPAGHLDPGESLVDACEREIVQLEWLTPEELKHRRAEHRSPLVEKCVDDFLAGRNFPLEVLSGQFA